MIAPRMRDEINKALGALLWFYWPKIDASYMKAEEGVSLTLGVKISPVAPGVQMVKIGISFVAEQVKDEIEFKVNKNQELLFKTVTTEGNEGDV